MGHRARTYRTRRLELRPYQLSDFQAWRRANETALPKQSPFDVDPWPSHRLTRENFRKLVLRQESEARENEAYFWYLFVKKSGEMVGWVDVSRIDRERFFKANLGYFVINLHRRKGYAEEALRKVIPAALQDLGFQRLEAAIDPSNRPSQKLAKKCGLEREGVRKHYWFQNGRWEDQVVFVTTRELWKKRQKHRSR